MRALMAVPTMYSIVKVTRTMVAAIASAHGYSAPHDNASDTSAFHMQGGRSWELIMMLVPGFNRAMVLLC